MHVRLAVLALLVLAAPAAAVSVAAGEPLRLAESCGERIDCVEMILYRTLTTGPDAGVVVEEIWREKNRLSGGVEVPLDYAEFVIDVKGRLNGGPLKTHRIVFEAFQEAIDCSGFGNHYAPVLDFSPEGRPMLMTDAGELELVEGLIQVGCKQCIELVDRETKETGYTHRTPFWDVWHADMPPEVMSYDDTGAFFVRRRGTCIKLHNDRRFEPVETEHCAPIHELERSNRGIPGMVRDPTSRLYEKPQSKYWMVLYAGACT